MLNKYGDVLTVIETAKVLRIGKNAAYELVRDGKITSIRVGRKYLIPKQCILDFLKIISYNESVD